MPPYLIAFAGLHALAVPVEVVQLQLHELDLGVFGQHAVQHVGMVMERETHVLDEPLALFFGQPGKTVEFLVNFVVLDPDVVQQVVVKVAGAGLLQLGVEDLVAVLFAVQETRV